MSTRRDTELTPAADVLFRQIRGLFRHAPLDAADFQELAPNVARTLSPDNPHLGMDVFIDILDDQVRDNKMEALITLLGFNYSSLNVLDRKSALNNEVHPRTIARWADEAIIRVVAEIESSYAVRVAVVKVMYGIGNYRDEDFVQFQFTWVGSMEEPEVQVNGDLVDTASFERLGNPGETQMITLRVEAEDVRDVEIDWPGELRPSFDLMGLTDKAITMVCGQNGCSINWVEYGAELTFGPSEA